ncbi:MAG: hypothetical protein KAS84_01910 [Anaerolineales bacterium]|nr:hypothetical protein [Anaerolineales bacterium]
MTAAITQPAGDDQKISLLYRRVVISILTTYILGGLFYADPFHFWQHTLCEFGTTRALQGNPIIQSPVLFSLGMLITVRFILEIAFFYHPTSVKF